MVGGGTEVVRPEDLDLVSGFVSVPAGGHNMHVTQSEMREILRRRAPGRPATYMFDKEDSLMTPEERRKKTAVLKRRARQNRSYYRRKLAKASAGGLGESDLLEAVHGNTGKEETVGNTMQLALAQNLFEEERIVRSAGLKSIVLDDVRQRFLRLPFNAQDALRHLAVFPQEFEIQAATSVMGLGAEASAQALDTLQYLFQHQLAHVVGERFELNELSKMFLREDTSLGAPQALMEVAERRYVTHYKEVLEKVNTVEVHRIGLDREKAMHVFDVERANIDCSINHCRKQGLAALRDFLSVAATPMRFCVDASTRVRNFVDALEGTNNQLNFLSTADQRNIARIQVAIAEAKCDMLSNDEAENQLVNAMTGMDWSRPSDPAAVLDVVLVLLLMAGIRIGCKQTDDGHMLLIKVLRVLNKLGQGNTTHGINALTNLVTIYVQKGEHDKARAVAVELLDSLHAMRYDDMPIYADALGVLAMVNIGLGDYTEAVRQFGQALEIVANWGSRTWRSIPMEHCLDLDIWLMEGLSIALNKQGNPEDAMYMSCLAAEARTSRGLHERPCATNEDDVLSLWTTQMRHLY